MSFIDKLFGSYETKELKKIEPIKNAVLKLEDKYRAMSEDELKSQTGILKDRLAAGETLDDILPDAFAVCREAAWRVLEMKHFPVQIAGGIALHRNNIAEMKTGEGKTLVATLPAYLNALSGKGVHVITVNEYLARRDSQWMGKLYNYPRKKRKPLTMRISPTAQKTSSVLTTSVTIWQSTLKTPFKEGSITPLWTRLTQSLLTRPERRLSYPVKGKNQLICIK